MAWHLNLENPTHKRNFEISSLKLQIPILKVVLVFSIVLMLLDVVTYFFNNY
jgi:hypothetical protein